MAHHNTDLWRISGVVDGTTWGMFPTGGAWLSTHIWQHYLFTGDKKFLADNYEVMKGAADFLLDYLQLHPKYGWELVGQGIANILSPIFGGIPATGAIARTMTNINNGGRTPVAGIIHAVVLLLIFLLLMPLAQYIPMACLAGVLVIVSYNMSGWRTFRELLNNPKADVAVLLITFFLTVIFDLTVAIEFGLVLACLIFIKRVMETTEVNIFKDEIIPTDTDGTVLQEEHLVIPDHTEVYEINGPYFFGIANRFEEVVMQTNERPKVRIIRMRKVPFIDSTGIHNLTNLCEMSHKEGVHVILSGVNPKVSGTERKSGDS